MTYSPHLYALFLLFVEWRRSCTKRCRTPIISVHPEGVHARFLDINLDESDPGPGTPVWYHHPKIRLQELISGVISSHSFLPPS